MTRHSLFGCERTLPVFSMSALQGSTEVGGAACAGRGKVGCVGRF